MIKYLLILSAWALPAFAADYRLNDPAILGEYTLAKADGNSEVKSAEIRYNADNELIVDFKGDGEGFVMSGPSKDGVVVDYEDEPNCDGDEEACYYDLRTLVTLGTAENARGEKIPQITIAVTSVNAFDEDDAGETTTYVLNWKREIPNAIAFYTNTKNPAFLSSFLKQCAKAVKPTVGYGIGNEAEICGSPDSVKMREPIADAIQWYIKDQGAEKDAKILTGAKIRSVVLNPARRVIADLDEKELKVPKAKLLEQFGKLENIIYEKYDTVYYHQFAYLAVLYLVNERSKIITTIQIRNQK